MFILFGVIIVILNPFVENKMKQTIANPIFESMVLGVMDFVPIAIILGIITIFIYFIVRTIIVLFGGVIRLSKKRKKEICKNTNAAKVAEDMNSAFWIATKAFILFLIALSVSNENEFVGVGYFLIMLGTANYLTTE